MFHNAQDYDALYGDDEQTFVRYCAPRLDEGYEVEEVRRQLADRAAQVPALVRTKVTVHRRVPRVAAA
jgi:uncharacterized protein